jgi:hypothetical protein
VTFQEAEVTWTFDGTTLTVTDLNSGGGTFVFTGRVNKAGDSIPSGAVTFQLTTETGSFVGTKEVINPTVAYLKYQEVDSLYDLGAVSFSFAQFKITGFISLNNYSDAANIPPDATLTVSISDISLFGGKKSDDTTGAGLFQYLPFTSDVFFNTFTPPKGWRNGDFSSIDTWTFTPSSGTPTGLKFTMTGHGRGWANQTGTATAQGVRGFAYSHLGNNLNTGQLVVPFTISFGDSSASVSATVKTLCTVNAKTTNPKPGGKKALKTASVKASCSGKSQTVNAIRTMKPEVTGDKF